MVPAILQLVADGMAKLGLLQLQCSRHVAHTKEIATQEVGCYVRSAAHMAWSVGSNRPCEVFVAS